MRQTKGLMGLLIILIVALNVYAVLASYGISPISVLTNYSSTGELIFPNNGWFNKSVNISITSTNITPTIITQKINLTGGVSGTYTSVSGGETTTYTSNLTISVEGITIVNYHANDSSGNIETENTSTIKIDWTKPVINSVVLNNYFPNTETDILVTVDALDNVRVCKNQIQIQPINPKISQLLV